MYLVNFKIAPSEVHGLGIFSLERVPKGKLVWKFDPSIDKSFALKEINLCPPSVRNYLFKHCYSPDGEEFIFCGDGGIYTNHSDTPNTRSLSLTELVAACNIYPGDEILSNYREFDDIKRESRHFLIK